MGVLGEIILKLGWDPSFWWQLGILLIMFFVLKVLLFDKLQWVLDHREERTSKLVEVAAALHHEADKVEADYKDRLKKARHQARDFFRIKREEWLELERKNVHGAEAEINQDYERKRLQLEEEFKNKKTEILEKTDEISNEFVNKLIQ